MQLIKKLEIILLNYSMMLLEINIRHLDNTEEEGQI